MIKYSIKILIFFSFYLYVVNSFCQSNSESTRGIEKNIYTNILNFPNNLQFYLILESKEPEKRNFHSFGVLFTNFEKNKPIKKNKTLGIIYSYKRLFEFSKNPNFKFGPMLYSKILYRDIYQSEVVFPDQIYSFPQAEKILKSNSIVIGTGSSFVYYTKKRVIFEIKTGVGVGRNFNSKINKEAVLFPIHFDGLFLINFGYIFKNK